MTSGHPLALHPSTVLVAGHVGAVRAAAAAGFEMVGIRLGPAFAGDSTPPLLDDPALLKQLRQVLAQTGIGVLDVEVFRLWPDTDPATLARAVEAGAELGAKVVLAVGHDPDDARLASNLNALAEMAGDRGLRVGLEFMAFSEVPSAAAARRLLSLVAHPALGVVVDPLHLARSGGSAADLPGLPLVVAQLCDAPAARPGTAAELAAEARTARLMPGEGGLDLTAFLAALPEGLPVSLEVTSSEVEDPAARATRGLAAMRALGL